ncbi:unnamed protein product, partial [Ectocarpus fasciculatus]
ESELAQHLRKEDMQNSQNDYAAAVTILNRALKEGRVAAAVARRKYDKAAAATSRVSRKLRKLLGGLAVDGGDEGDSDVDSESSTRSHCSNDSWFSADELSSDEDEAGSKDELETAVKARAAAVRQGHEEQKRRVLVCKAAAMTANRNYKRLLKVADIACGSTSDDEGMTEASINEAQGARPAAVEAWVEYKRAAQSMKEDYGGSDQMDVDGGQEEAYDSTGWEEWESGEESSSDLSDDEGDEGESDDLIDLEKGFTFAEESDADETWHTVVRKIERELRRQGFYGRRVAVKGKKIAGGSGRCGKIEVRCAAYRKGRTKKSSSVRQRAKQCGCEFQVGVTWNTKGPPTIQK